jgi:hypothetical protein
MGISTFPQPPFAGFPGGVDLGTVMVMPTGSNPIYLRSTGPQSQDPPALSGKLVATLSAALAQVRSGLFDTVMVLPGHSESVSTATMLDNLVAGTRIIGFGCGSNMPVFRFTATGSQWVLNDADVIISGLRLRLEGADGVVKAIVCTAADNLITGCDIEVASGANNKATIAIEAGTGATRFSMVGNRLRGSATHNVTDGVKVVAAVDGVRITDNEMVFSATAANGNVHFTAAATNLLVARNLMANTHTASTACVTIDNVAATGLLAWNGYSTINDGTVARARFSARRARPQHRVLLVRRAHQVGRSHADGGHLSTGPARGAHHLSPAR